VSWMDCAANKGFILLEDQGKVVSPLPKEDDLHQRMRVSSRDEDSLQCNILSWK